MKYLVTVVCATCKELLDSEEVDNETQHVPDGKLYVDIGFQVGNHKCPDEVAR